MDQTALANWHDFYVTMATASASLIGLLFVALSINLDAVSGPSRDDLRAFAEQAFASFTVVLLIAAIFLVPTGGPSSIGVACLVLGGGAGARMLRRAPAVGVPCIGANSARRCSGDSSCPPGPTSGSSPPGSGSLPGRRPPPTGSWQ